MWWEERTLNSALTEVIIVRIRVCRRAKRKERREMESNLDQPDFQRLYETSEEYRNAYILFSLSLSPSLIVSSYSFLEGLLDQHVASFALSKGVLASNGLVRDSSWTQESRLCVCPCKRRESSDKTLSNIRRMTIMGAMFRAGRCSKSHFWLCQVLPWRKNERRREWTVKRSFPPLGADLRLDRKKGRGKWLG